MTEIEKIQSKILMRMQEILDNEQLQKLENVLVLEFHNWEKILRTFLASKRIENCSEGTLKSYNDCNKINNNTE